MADILGFSVNGEVMTNEGGSSPINLPTDGIMLTQDGRQGNPSYRWDPWGEMGSPDVYYLRIWDFVNENPKPSSYKPHSSTTGIKVTVEKHPTEDYYRLKLNIQCFSGQAYCGVSTQVNDNIITAYSTLLGGDVWVS